MVTNQAYLFFIFTMNGILIGLLFDFFRIIRKVFHTNDLITYIQDILFWILTGITVLYSIFIFNNGELRLFMFLAILLGAFVYMLFISSYVIAINVKIPPEELCFLISISLQYPTLLNVSKRSKNYKYCNDSI